MLGIVSANEEDATLKGGATRAKSLGRLRFFRYRRFVVIFADGGQRGQNFGGDQPIRNLVRLFGFFRRGIPELVSRIARCPVRELRAQPSNHSLY